MERDRLSKRGLIGGGGRIYRRLLFFLLVLSAAATVGFQVSGTDVFIVVKEIAVLIAALGGGTLAVPIVSRLKRWLGTTGNWTIAIAVIVSALLGILALIAEGQLTPSDIGVENLSTWGLAIFVASQAVYRRLKDEGVIGA